MVTSKVTDVTMKLEAGVSAAGESHRGSRAANQDVVVLEPSLGLYAVLDGMGGAAAGEVAAQLASEALVEFTRKHFTSEWFSRRELLEYGIDAAAAAVFRAALKNTEWRGMGTTVVACLIAGPAEVVIGHAGDSRAYLLRDDHLVQLTHDHTSYQQLLDCGAPRDDDNRARYGHMLTRNLGAQNGVQAEMLGLRVRIGDRVLLCSDGLYGCVPAEEIKGILRTGIGARAAAQALIELALRSNATDNVSAIVLDVLPP